MERAQQRVFGNMPLVDKISRWRVDEGTLDDPAPLNLVVHDKPLHNAGQLGDDKNSDDSSSHNGDRDNSNSDDGLDSPNVPIYQDVVTKSCAYQWLVARLHREVDFTSFGHDGMSPISTQIRQKLDSQPEIHLISRQSGPPICKMAFRSEWDPVAFVREQEYPENPGEAIEWALTLTEGENDDAEAMACSEYLCRTWPLLGEDVMKLIKDVVRTDLPHGSNGSISMTIAVMSIEQGSIVTSPIEKSAD
jgi:hypothetical protein